MPTEFPYPVYWVPGSNALAEWDRLRQAKNGWPIVVGDAEALEFLAESLELEDRRDVQAILKKAAKLQHPQGLLDHRRSERERYREYLGSAVDEDPEPEVGDWPDQVVPAPQLSTAEEILTGQPYKRVAIVVVPTEFPWEVPAYLNWGGWNENPPPEIHVAALRAWHEKYGATLIGLSGDVMNLRVTRRPATRNEALGLAREHYVYCADIVDQGVGTLANLAASYLDSDWWYFWWD